MTLCDQELGDNERGGVVEKERNQFHGRDSKTANMSHQSAWEAHLGHDHVILTRRVIRAHLHADRKRIDTCPRVAHSRFGVR